MPAACPAEVDVADDPRLVQRVLDQTGGIPVCSQMKAKIRAATAKAPGSLPSQALSSTSML